MCPNSKNRNDNNIINQTNKTTTALKSQTSLSTQKSLNIPKNVIKTSFIEKSSLKLPKIYIPKKIKNYLKSKKKGSINKGNTNESSIIKPLTTISQKIGTENTPNKFCRVCYEKEQKDDPLIAPCQCEGSIKYIHSSCIKKWIINSKNLFDNPQCEVCKKYYIIKFKNNELLNKKKCCSFVLSTFLFSLGLIVIGGSIIYALYYILTQKEILSRSKKWLYFSVSGSIIIVIILLVSVCFYKKNRNKFYYEGEIKFDVLDFQQNQKSTLNVERHLEPQEDYNKSNILVNNFVLDQAAINQ